MDWFNHQPPTRYPSFGYPKSFGPTKIPETWGPDSDKKKKQKIQGLVGLANVGPTIYPPWN